MSQDASRLLYRLCDSRQEIRSLLQGFGEVPRTLSGSSSEPGSPTAHQVYSGRSLRLADEGAHTGPIPAQPHVTLAFFLGSPRNQGPDTLFGRSSINGRAHSGTLHTAHREDAECSSIPSNLHAIKIERFSGS